MAEPRLELTLACDGERFASADEVRLAATYANAADAPFSLTFWWSRFIRVRDAAGREVTPGPGPTLPCGKAETPVVLAPGERHARDEPLGCTHPAGASQAVGWSYQLPPGRYSLVLEFEAPAAHGHAPNRREDAWSGRVESAPVEIEILPPPPGRFARLRRALRILGLFVASALVCLIVLAGYRLRDRSDGYALDLAIDPGAAQRAGAPLQVGFGRMRINPSLDPGAPPVWLAGFRNGRRATAIHDDLWAVACVLDDGPTRLGIVSLDAIGIFYDDVIAIRRRLAAAWELDYVVVAATHNHSTPDLMGLWGPQSERTGIPEHGVDPAYREQVIAASTEALGQACAALAPARLSLHHVSLDPAGLVEDTRRPEVYDPDLRLLRFRAVEGPETLGSIVTWANHPETTWSRNTEITADFPGYLRDALERGLIQHGEVETPGLGGIHLFVNGAVGGLMTTHPRTTVPDPFGGPPLSEPSHAKARAVGYQLARRLLSHVRDTPADETTRAPLGVWARTVELPVSNVNFLLAPLLGVLDRGHVSLGKLSSEVALITLGEASILCVPGEIYPELVNGGIERAPGGDHDVEPVEIPPLRELMPGRLQLVFGLANDEVGYIIPRSEWDERPPFLYGAKKSPYGEVNSLGPDTAPLLHAAYRELCARAAEAGD